MKKFTMRKILMGCFTVCTFATAAAQETVYPAPAQKETITLTNATIHVGNGQVITNGNVVITNGKITEVGATTSTAGKIIDCRGKHIYPGLILTATETLQKIKIFFDKFHLEKYPWIHIGKDYKYFFGGFYQPKTIPVLAFYNTKKQLVYFSQGAVKKKEITEALKK